MTFPLDQRLIPQTFPKTTLNPYGLYSPSTGDGGSPPGLPPLDGLSPWGAWSLRELFSSWAGLAVVRVKRSSDNAESDFTAAEVADGTMLTWTGAGNNAHGVYWYDQSGNSNHCYPYYSTKRPYLVKDGIQEEAWRFGIPPTGTTTAAAPFRTDTSIPTFTGSASSFSVVTNSFNPRQGTSPYISPCSPWEGPFQDTNLQMGSIGVTRYGAGVLADVDEINTRTVRVGLNHFVGKLNGVTKYSDTTANTIVAEGTPLILYLGGYRQALGYSGYVHEAVAFTSDIGQTALDAIETEQIAYYGITP